MNQQQGGEPASARHTLSAAPSTSAATIQKHSDAPVPVAPAEESQVAQESWKTHCLQADMASSGERLEGESFSSDRLGTSPKIRAGHDPVDIRNPHMPHANRQASAGGRGSDMELSQSQISTCSSPPLLLPPPLSAASVHASKGSMGADTLAESDTLTLDGASGKSGCEEETAGQAPAHVLMQPHHSAPARIPDDRVSLDPTDMPSTTGDGGVAKDQDEHYWAWTPSIMTAYGFPVLRPHTMPDKPPKSARRQLSRTLTEPCGASPDKAAADIDALMQFDSSSTPLPNPISISRISGSPTGPSPHDLHLTADHSDMSMPMPERSFSPDLHAPALLPPRAPSPTAACRTYQSSAVPVAAAQGRQVHSFAVSVGSATSESSPPASSPLARGVLAARPLSAVASYSNRNTSKPARTAPIQPATHMQPSAFAPSSCDSERSMHTADHPAPAQPPSSVITPQKPPRTLPEAGSARRSVQEPMHSPSVSLFGNNIVATTDTPLPSPEAMPASTSSSSSPWSLSPQQEAVCSSAADTTVPATCPSEPHSNAEVQQTVHSDLENSFRLSECCSVSSEPAAAALGGRASVQVPQQPHTEEQSPPESPWSPKGSDLVSVKDWMDDSEGAGEHADRDDAACIPSLSAHNLVTRGPSAARAPAYPAQRPNTTGVTGTARPSASTWACPTQHSVELSPRMPWGSEGGTPRDMYSDSESIPLPPADSAASGRMNAIFHNTWLGHNADPAMHGRSSPQPLQPSPPLSAPASRHTSPKPDRSPSSSPPPRPTQRHMYTATRPAPPPPLSLPLPSPSNSSVFGTPCMSDRSKSSSASYATAAGGTSFSSARSRASFVTATGTLASTAQSPSSPRRDGIPQFSFPSPEEVARSASPMHSSANCLDRSHSANSSDTDSSARMLGGYGLAPLDTEAVFFDSSEQLPTPSSQPVAASDEIRCAADGVDGASVHDNGDEGSDGESGQLCMRRISSATFGEAIHIHGSDLESDSDDSHSNNDDQMSASGTPRDVTTRDDRQSCIELSPTPSNRLTTSNMDTIPGEAGMHGPGQLTGSRFMPIVHGETDSMGMGGGGDTLAIMAAYGSTDLSNMHASLLSGAHPSMLSTGAPATGSVMSPEPSPEKPRTVEDRTRSQILSCLSDTNLVSLSERAAGEGSDQADLLQHLWNTAPASTGAGGPPANFIRHSSSQLEVESGTDMWGIGHVVRSQQGSMNRPHARYESKTPPLLPLAVLLQQGQDEDADDERGSSGLLDSEDEDSGPLGSARMLARRVSPRISPRVMSGPDSPLMADALSGLPLAPILEESAHDVAPSATDAAVDTSRPLDSETAALSMGLSGGISGGISGNMAERARAELAAVFARAAEQQPDLKSPSHDYAMPERKSSTARMLPGDMQSVGHLMGGLDGSGFRPEAAQTMSTVNMGEVACSQDMQEYSFLTEDSGSSLLNPGHRLSGAAAPVPAVSEPAPGTGASYNRFKHVMADRSNSIDLPQCIEGEEMTSSIVQGSTHTEHAAAHDSPASVQGRCKEASHMESVHSSPLVQAVSPAPTTARSGRISVSYGMSAEFLSYRCSGEGLDSLPRRSLRTTPPPDRATTPTRHGSNSLMSYPSLSLPNTPGSVRESSIPGTPCTPHHSETARSGMSNFTGVSYSTMPSPYPRYVFRYSQIEFNPEMQPEDVPEWDQQLHTASEAGATNPLAPCESECSRMVQWDHNTRALAMTSPSDLEGFSGECTLRHCSASSTPLSMAHDAACTSPAPSTEQTGTSPATGSRSHASPMLSPSGRWVPGYTKPRHQPHPIEEDFEGSEGGGAGLEVLQRTHPGKTLLSGSWPEGHVSWYVQHWDLTDAVIVVKQEDDEEAGGFCNVEADPAQGGAPDYSLPAGNVISSVLTDGDGADSHLSSHMTSQFTANAESSRLTANALSSLLHPLPTVGAATGCGAACPDAMAPQRLQPTDQWLPMTSQTSSDPPNAVAPLPAMALQPQEAPAAPIAVQEWEGHPLQELSVVSSSAAGTQSQMQADGGATTEQRIQTRSEGRNSATVSRRENELSMDFDLTDALMSKDITKPSRVDSAQRRAPQLSEQPAVPSFVDDYALSIALEAHEAGSDDDFGSPRGDQGMAARDLENSAAVLVNSLWCSFGTMPTDIECTVDSSGAPESTGGTKKGWKGALLRALGSKSKRRLGTNAESSDAGASASTSTPQQRPSSRFLPSMLSSIGSNTGRRSSAREQAARHNYMFNTTGTDIMETAQSDWAFNTVGAHPYSAAAPSSVQSDWAFNTVGARPHSSRAPSSVGTANTAPVRARSSVGSSAMASEQQQQKTKCRWWHSLGRTR